MQPLPPPPQITGTSTESLHHIKFLESGLKSAEYIKPDTVKSSFADLTVNNLCNHCKRRATQTGPGHHTRLNHICSSPCLISG